MAGEFELVVLRREGIEGGVGLGWWWFSVRFE
jgi:hypothetical protein